MRWFLVVGSFKIKILFKNILSLTFIGALFNTILLGSSGGDIVKGYYLSKKEGELIDPFLTILLDLLIGFWTVSIIGLFALTYYSW